jgi:hypothetical protein
LFVVVPGIRVDAKKRNESSEYAATDDAGTEHATSSCHDANSTTRQSYDGAIETESSQALKRLKVKQVVAGPLRQGMRDSNFDCLHAAFPHL